MFGLSYGELFFLIGATAALVGPKDLPLIARVAGRLAGRAIGYVQLARGQFDTVMQQTQARQVHKELQDTMAQLDAIRYEIRSLSLMNPSPLTRRMTETPLEPTPDTSGGSVSHKNHEENLIAAIDTRVKDYSSTSLGSTILHSQATAYARLAESEAVKAAFLKINVEQENLKGDNVDFSVIPVSAESAGFLPNRKENLKGSDIVLEAVLEAEVAQNAKDFFSQPQNQIQ
ncbi:hypothetical protein SLA2020_040740 [Shorea laevis]